MEKSVDTVQQGKYQKSMVKEIRRLARFGLSNVEVAEFYGIGATTLERYLRKYPELYKSLGEGRMLDSMKVVDSLHKQALGYTIQEIEVAEAITRDGRKVKLRKVTDKYIHPNVTAAIYLLKTRHGDKWMDIVKSEQTKNLNILVQKVDFSDISTEDLLTLKGIGVKRIPDELSRQTIKLPAANGSDY